MDNISLALRDLIELADHLRQERLFVLSEQSRLHELNEKVVCASSKLAQLAWVSAQHRLNLNRLVLSRPDCSPAACCQRADSLDLTEFIDAYKVLGYQDAAMFGQFLEGVRNAPELVASCLAAGDRLMPELTPQVIQSMVAGLYGSCLLPSDRALVLRLLKTLSQLQLVTSDDPRRLLRHGSCAFARLYSVFHEGLFSAKLFLTAALHAPITHVLTEDDKFLDIDPDKIAVRFPPEERLKKFGVEGTAEYEANVRRYRAWTVRSLVQLTQRFIRSLRDNLHCFPSSICWLIRHIASTATVPPKEVFVMCCDLVLTYFICLAVVNPEPWGITDVGAISYVARSNLIQVAQILQMLALSKHEPIDPRLQDLYSQFDKECVSSIVDSMLEVSGGAGGPGGPANGGEPTAPPDNSKLNGLSRNAALFTEAELFALVGFLQAVAGNSTDVDVDKKALMNVLSLLPRNPSPTPTPTHHTNGGQAKKSSASAKGSSYKSDALDEGLGGEEEVNKPVLVIPFDTNANPSVGFLSEQKVLEMQKKGILVDDLVRVGIEGGGVLVVAAGGGAVNGLDQVVHEVVDSGGSGARGGGEVKGGRGGGGGGGRLSLEADNTSDNLEAVSEAASNHSVTSSISDTAEDHNDNLSDMISANVSGRDTPSSQMTEGDDTGPVPGGARGGQLEGGIPVAPPSQANKQQCRFDIDEKFGKFQIKKLMEGAADETISMVSDTWSTDVLASDSEIIEAVPPMQPSLPNTPQLLDVSETASDAWSTCVMASDSERLTEVDTDDTASVARSDDTARSEVGESRGEPDGAGGEEGAGSGGSASAAPPGGGFGFRSLPIREENERLLVPVPVSPTKVEGAAVVAGMGAGLRGGSFRRRTLDCASVPSRSAGGSLSLSEERERTPDLKSSLAPSSSSLNTPKLSQQTSSQEVSMEESEAGGASGGGIVCLSTVSLASTSSSSSSEPRLKATQELSLPGTPSVLNGSVVMVDSASSGSATSSKPLPSTSTGAIPKSISFDKTAERGDKESLDEDGKSKRSFFRFKLPFKKPKGGRGGSSSFRADDLVDCEEPRPSRIDTSDDILAKYRRKVVVTSSNGVAKQPGDVSATSKGGEAEEEEEEEDERLVIDPTNVEASFAFRDAKKKLRLVLSTAEVQHNMPEMPNANGSGPSPGPPGQEGQLVSFLKLQLAEAMNLQDRPLIAHLHETLRCVRLFDSQGCVKLFGSLKEDYKHRTPYVSYLVHCRQSLLSTLVHLERLTERVRCERAVCQRFLMAVCVRLFLEKREALVGAFAAEFQQLTLADEKNDLLLTFLQRLSVEMERDPLWQAASDAQLDLARTAIERAVVSRVYIYAMFPNGDGDVSRDQVLHEHMKKLSNVITPSHKDLRIPKVFCYECPWPSAQAEVVAMSAHKTAGDKVACVLRCCQTILNLLSLAAADQLSTVPAADDLVPVLVYVLIKANPPSLLSTVAYVNSFYESRLEGEDRYWWVQFCSAIEFIKTMDYVLSD